MPKAAAQPWDQQPGESAKAYQAFALYRDAAAARSLDAVGRKLGKSTGLMERWSARFQWVLRAAARDQHLAREEAHKAEQAARAEAERRAKRVADAVEQQWSLSVGLANAVGHRIDAAKVKQPDGSVRVDLDPRSLVRLADALPKVMHQLKEAAGLGDLLEKARQAMAGTPAVEPVDADTAAAMEEAAASVQAARQGIILDLPPDIDTDPA